MGGVWEGSVDGLVGGVRSESEADYVLAELDLADVGFFFEAADIHLYLFSIKLSKLW